MFAKKAENHGGWPFHVPARPAGHLLEHHVPQLRVAAVIGPGVAAPDAFTPLCGTPVARLGVQLWSLGYAHAMKATTAMSGHEHVARQWDEMARRIATGVQFTLSGQAADGRQVFTPVIR